VIVEVFKIDVGKTRATVSISLFLLTCCWKTFASVGPNGSLQNI